MVERGKTKTLRCAIYTRKSSEEGLEQDFNSLQAQREACEAYIASQKHEGWRALSHTYDDGGYSGGSIERPALKQLLTDIEAGNIDVVVVYKVDRLTRSLNDFAKIVEIFDAQGVSFVSVTQQFNTTTSMGRLTLNVLLSFAQFEREVTGERIRDKVAASKKKGMWMGGWVPIGYDLKDRALYINKAEAETVRTIFRLYLELGNVQSVQAELEKRRLTTKPRATATGRMIGALPFRRGHIYHILSNPIYIGEIRHKDSRHLGQHPALIKRATWDAVQSQLRANGQKHKTRAEPNSANMLAGLLFDDQGNRFTPTHSLKNGKRYRYYAVLPPSGRTSKKFDRPNLRIAASEIESLVAAELKACLSNHKRLVELLALESGKPAELRRVLAQAKAFALALEKDISAESRTILTEIVKSIVIAPTKVRIELIRHALLSELATEAAVYNGRDDQERLVVIEVPTSFALRGVETRLVVANTADAPKRTPEPALLKAVARGFVWFEKLVNGHVNSITELAQREGVTDRYVSQLINLAFLMPSTLESIVDGSQPAHVTLDDLVAQLAPRWPATGKASAQMTALRAVKARSKAASASPSR